MTREVSSLRVARACSTERRAIRRWNLPRWRPFRTMLSRRPDSFRTRPNRQRAPSSGSRRLLSRQDPPLRLNRALHSRGLLPVGEQRLPQAVAAGDLQAPARLRPPAHPQAVERVRAIQESAIPAEGPLLQPRRVEALRAIPPRDAVAELRHSTRTIRCTTTR